MLNRRGVLRFSYGIGRRPGRSGRFKRSRWSSEFLLKDISEAILKMEGLEI